MKQNGVVFYPGPVLYYPCSYSFHFDRDFRETWCSHLSMRSAVSRDTFFKMVDNTVSDSDPSWEERGDEGPINPIEEVKRPGANLATSEKAKIARERKSSPIRP